MANIKPFKAITYSRELFKNINNLICPPYDVISSQESEFYRTLNKYNIINLELPPGNNPYQNAKNTLANWLNNRILIQYTENSLYIYEQEFKLNNQIKTLQGIICLVKLEDFDKDIIIPHERTIKKAKQDRLNLLKSTACNISSICSIYEDSSNSIKNAINMLHYNTPDIEAIDLNNHTHKIWKISNKEFISNIKNMFINKQLFIADGHHRYETALAYSKMSNLNNSKYTMMTLINFQDNGLLVLPTHRILNKSLDINYKNIVNSCKQYFHISKFMNKHEALDYLNDPNFRDIPSFVMYCGNNLSFLFRIKDFSNLKKMFPHSSEQMISLDTFILQELIFKNLLHMQESDIRENQNISYTNDSNKAYQAVDDNEAICSFIVKASNIKNICRIALNHEIMPQKTTYFYPKLPTGLILNKIS